MVLYFSYNFEGILEEFLHMIKLGLLTSVFRTTAGRKIVHLDGTKLEGMLLVNKSCLSFEIRFTECSCETAISVLNSVLLGQPLGLCWQRSVVSRCAGCCCAGPEVMGLKNEILP